jgi:nicotinamide-nucleotide amidase
MSELEPIAERVAGRMIERRETIAIAESAAGGLIAAALLRVPGASKYFLGGAVLYTGAARQALLGITPDDMAGMRPASEPYAQLVARRCRERMGASWGLAETGAAGPTGNRYGDSAGHPCVAVSGPRDEVRTIETGFAGPRRQHAGLRGRRPRAARGRPRRGHIARPRAARSIARVCARPRKH